MKNNEKEKEIFDANYAKQSKMAKKLMLCVFCGMGALFLIAGAVCLCLKAVELKEAAIVWLAVGAIFVLAGIILYFVFPARYNYDKFKNRTRKYGVVNLYEMSAKIAELEERIAALENKSETPENKDN